MEDLRFKSSVFQSWKKSSVDPRIAEGADISDMVRDLGFPRAHKEIRRMISIAQETADKAILKMMTGE